MNAISSPTQQKHAVKNIICIGETDFVAIKWDESLAEMRSPLRRENGLVVTLGDALCNDNLTKSNYGEIGTALADYAAMCNTPSLASSDYASLFILKIDHLQYIAQWVGCLNASSNYEAMSKSMFMLRIILGSDKAKRRSLKKSKIVKALIAGGAV